MEDGRRSLRGRGAPHNPPNRFEPIHYEPDPEAADPDTASPKTEFFRDTSRSVISRNDSPDVGFEASLNPYRGCEHGCIYCLSGETLTLMADGTTRPLGDLQVGDEIYGTVRRGWYRRFVKTRVLAHWEARKAAYRVTLEDGTSLIASGDHRFLTLRGWKFVTGAQSGARRRPHLTTNDKLMGIGGLLERVHHPPGQPLQILRLTGGLQEHLRFFQTVGPAILRQRDIDGVALKTRAQLGVAAIEPLGRMTPLFDITTGTEDFIANGVVSHNCYARPTHEYLGFSAGLDFETKILVKEEAPDLLRKEMSSPRWKPQALALSGVTDPYQPIERRLQLTRRCLEVLLDFRNPVLIITKNRLVTRDADLLGALAARDACAVFLSVTTFQRDIHRVLEPRTSSPRARIEAIRELSAAGIPVGVLVAPVIPGLTDHELPSIVEVAARAGARRSGYVVLRLPHGISALFEDWLERHFPDRKEKVLNRIRSLRGGRLNETRFGKRMRGEGVFAEQIAALHDMACKKAGIPRGGFELSTSHFRSPSGRQLEFF